MDSSSFNKQIPPSDEAFNLFVNLLVTIVTANAMAWNIPAAAIADLTALLTPWNAAFGVANISLRKSRTQAQVETKDEARKALEKEVRKFLKAYILFNPAITNAQRMEMGLKVYDTVRTDTPVPDTFPVLVIENIGGGIWRGRYADSANPTKRGKPKGVKSIEVRCGLDPNGEFPDRYPMVFTFTKTPFFISWGPEMRNKVGSIVARWKNSRGEGGPYCDPLQEPIS